MNRYSSDAELLADIVASKMGLRSASSRLWERIGNHGRPPGCETGIGYIALCRAVALYDPTKCRIDRGATPYTGHFLAYYRQWCRKAMQVERVRSDYPITLTIYAAQQLRKVDSESRPRAVSVELLDQSSDWSCEDDEAGTEAYLDG